jgi:hypothetical protein
MVVMELLDHPWVNLNNASFTQKEKKKMAARIESTLVELH